MVGLRPAARALAGDRLVLDVAEVERALQGLQVQRRAAGAEDADGGRSADPDVGGADLDELAAVAGVDHDPRAMASDGALLLLARPFS